MALDAAIPGPKAVAEPCWEFGLEGELDGRVADRTLTIEFHQYPGAGSAAATVPKRHNTPGRHISPGRDPDAR